MLLRVPLLLQGKIEGGQTAALHPSHVLRAMGRDEEEAHAALRISFGRFNRAEDVEAAARHIIKGVELARAGNPLWPA